MRPWKTRPPYHLVLILWPMRQRRRFLIWLCRSSTTMPCWWTQLTKNILQNLVGVMTDRAANMKAFDRQLEGYVQNNVDLNIQLEFLHCSAHFLLGLSTAADKALKEVAETQGQLGREVLPQFKRFKSPESAVCI